ncbi:MAG: hypothetical protein ACM3TR_20130 [Caulobacteraceae bacterium]
MARMRTIKSAIEYIKQQDPSSCVTEWWLRQLAKSGRIKTHKAGSKYLIDIDYLEEFFKNPPEDVEQKFDSYGKLRKVF